MSELKAYCPYANRDGLYHKSEVDKVIAEKDAEIAELKSRIPVWHKFSEETPEHHQDILCYCPRAKFCKVALRRWDEGTRFDVFNQELYTHWMRLPEELTEDKIFTIKQ